MLYYMAKRLIEAFLIKKIDVCFFTDFESRHVYAEDIRPYAKGPLNRQVIGPVLAWFKGPFRRHFCIRCHNKKVCSINFQPLAVSKLFS